MRKGKPNDPERRSRIITAALQVMRTEGISGASYRRIAAQAEVPLGSVTYYFPTLDGLVLDALNSTRGHLEPRYAAPLREARTAADVVDALVDATIGATSPGLDDIRLYEDIRHHGARDPKIAAILQAVEDDSLVMLAPVLPTPIALAVNALLWGWWSHRLAHPATRLDDATVRGPYAAIVALANREHASTDEEHTRV